MNFPTTNDDDDISAEPRFTDRDGDKVTPLRLLLFSFFSLYFHRLSVLYVSLIHVYILRSTTITRKRNNGCSFLFDFIFLPNEPNVASFACDLDSSPTDCDTASKFRQNIMSTKGGVFFLVETRLAGTPSYEILRRPPLTSRSGFDRVSVCVGCTTKRGDRIAALIKHELAPGGGGGRERVIGRQQLIRR